MIKSIVFTASGTGFALANINAHCKLEEWLYNNKYIEKILSHSVIVHDSPTNYTISISVIYESK